MSDSNNKKLKGLDKKKTSGLWQRARDFTFQNANFTFDMSVEAFTVTVFHPIVYQISSINSKTERDNKTLQNKQKIA